MTTGVPIHTAMRNLGVTSQENTSKYCHVQSYPVLARNHPSVQCIGDNSTAHTALATDLRMCLFFSVLSAFILFSKFHVAVWSCSMDCRSISASCVALCCHGFNVYLPMTSDLWRHSVHGWAWFAITPIFFLSVARVNNVQHTVYRTLHPGCGANMSLCYCLFFYVSPKSWAWFWKRLMINLRQSPKVWHSYDISRFKKNLKEKVKKKLRKAYEKSYENKLAVLRRAEIKDTKNLLNTFVNYRENRYDNFIKTA